VSTRPPPQHDPARFTALVLAGSRGAAGDELASAQGQRHRALIPVYGVPMLVRVIRTLRAAPSIGAIVVSIDDPAALADVPELAALVAQGALALRRSERSPSRSVVVVLESLAAGVPALVTTADHPLLTPAMVEHFTGACRQEGADVRVGLVAASLLRERFPESKRTYLPMRDDLYSGANLFAFLTPEARRAAEFWVRAEASRKRPWRLALAFGPRALVAFWRRRYDLDAALAQISRVVGVRVRAVRMPFAEAAIDVDKASDLALATRILAEREERRGQSGDVV
jgi:GTP:adenosylcobinamide-phosphate guanylyltransferase